MIIIIYTCVECVYPQKMAASSCINGSAYFSFHKEVKSDWIDVLFQYISSAHPPFNWNLSCTLYPTCERPRPRDERCLQAKKGSVIVVDERQIARLLGTERH